MSGTNGHRAERDGCGCPPWVLRCAHFEGQVLRLHDFSVGKALHLPGCPRRDYVLHTHAVDLGGALRPANCGCPLETVGNAAFHRFFPSLPAAEAEFRKREEELRSREPE